MAVLSVASGGQPSKDGDAVRVEAIPGAGYVGVVVENRRAYDVTVTAHDPRPERARHANRSRRPASTPAIRRPRPPGCRRPMPRKPWKWRYRFHWTKGSVDARHDDKTLYLPAFRKGPDMPGEPGLQRAAVASRRQSVRRGFRHAGGDDGLCGPGGRRGRSQGVFERGRPGQEAHGRIQLRLDRARRRHDRRVPPSSSSTASSSRSATGSSPASRLPSPATPATPPSRTCTSASTPPPTREHMQSHPITFITAQGTVAEPRAGRIYTAQ